MYYQDPRDLRSATNGQAFTPANGATTGFAGANGPTGIAGNYAGTTGYNSNLNGHINGHLNGPIGGFTAVNPGFGGSTAEINMLFARIEELRMQINILTDYIRRSAPLGRFGANENGLDPIAFVGNRHFTSHATFTTDSNLRLRENDTHLFCELFLPHLSLGDLNVEVVGNRIVARTRVPVSPAARWWSLGQQLPRGFELFELADGRVEFNWSIPVSFDATEVEATWRDGFICVCVPKTDAAQKHIVKVAKDTLRKTGSDAN